MLDGACQSDSYHAGLSRDGELLVVGDRPHHQALVMDVDRPMVRARFGDHPGINAVALSPDGRWIAAGSRLGAEIKVWDRATGWLVAHLPDSTAEAVNPCVAFSPDGQWLVAGSQGAYRFWHTGSWTLGRTIPRDRLEEMPGLIAFARDGRLLAITPSPRTVQLVETATGQTLAHLSAPDPHEIQGMGFSPDNGLLAVATDSPALQVWDLWQIRRYLAPMHLDWDLPPLPARRADEDSPARLQLRVLPIETGVSATPVEAHTTSRVAAPAVHGETTIEPDSNGPGPGC
jgi:WD40 repeat protein